MAYRNFKLTYHDSFYIQATYRCQYTSFQCFIVKRLPVQQCIIPYFTCYCYADLLQYTVTTCFHQMKGRTRRRRKKKEEEEEKMSIGKYI